MSLYFFHLRDGVDLILDEEGRMLELSALADAALKEARSIISADILTGHLRLDQRIDVEDEFHAVVHSLDFADAIAITAPD